MKEPPADGARALRGAGVLIRDICDVAGCDGCLRVSIGTPAEKTIGSSPLLTTSSRRRPHSDTSVSTRRALAYRAYHAMPEVRAPDGTLVNAIVGFLNFVERLLRDRKPTTLYVAFEFGEDWRPQFRVKLLPEYKSARVATGDEPADEVGPQILVIEELLRALGISTANANECEAKTLSRRSRPRSTDRSR